MKEAITSIAIDDEAGLAKCLEQGRRAILGEGVDIRSMWSNYGANLDVLLVIPDVGRLPIDISIVGPDGKFVRSQAEAAVTVARQCVGFAKRWAADPVAFARWYQQMATTPH